MPPMHTKLPFVSAQLWPSGAPGQVVQVIGSLLNPIGSSKPPQLTVVTMMRATSAAITKGMNRSNRRGIVPPFRGLPRWLWGRAPGGPLFVESEPS